MGRSIEQNCHSSVPKEMTSIGQQRFHDRFVASTMLSLGSGASILTLANILRFEKGSLCRKLSREDFKSKKTIPYFV